MRRVSRAILPFLSTLMVLVVLAGCSAPQGDGISSLGNGDIRPALSKTAFARDFVTVKGRSFELAGRKFRFVGANIYDAAASSAYSCRPGSEMSDATLLNTLRYLHDVGGVTVLRFWAYQTYTQAGTYWAGMDRVLADAREVGLKVIPVLEDGPGNCTTMPAAVPKALYQGDTWFTQGYQVPYGSASLSYRDYVKLIVAHYASDPTILGWSMMNEADTSARDSSGASVLVGFAKDVAGVIRSVDTRHLITVGTQGNGAPGASGPDFSAVYRLSQISFSEVHDWGYWGSDADAMPGGSFGRPPNASSPECFREDAPIGCSFARNFALDKPLVVGEAGMKGVTSRDRALRSSRMRAKMIAAFQAGASGYLVWGVTTAETDGYDIRIDTRDPLLPVMMKIALEVR